MAITELPYTLLSVDNITVTDPDDSHILAEIPRYPLGLPCFQRDGYQFDAKAAVDVTEFDQADRRREIYSSIPQEVQVSTKLTDSEYSLFQYFVRYTIRNGALPMAVKIRVGIGMAYAVGYFLDANNPYSVSMEGNRHVISMGLKIDDIPYLPDTGGMSPDGLINAANTLHRAIHGVWAGGFSNG